MHGTAAKLVVPIVAVLCLADAEAQPAAAGAQPAVTDEQRARARVHYEEGVRRYNLGELDDAIRAFRRAYLETAAPSLLFNIAQAYRRKGPGSCGHAAKFYRSYLREQPNAPDREQAERLALAVEDCARSETPVPLVADSDVGQLPAQPAQPQPAAPAVTTPARPNWIVIGVGATAVVTGGVLQVLARNKFSSLEDECPCAPERWETWRSVEYTSYGLLVAGSATVAGALIWWARSRGDESPGTNATVVPMRDGAAFTVLGAF